ncbi:TIGR03943 family putative permease subunit [Nocardiopsis deserti]|uniref:TIGR03943 family putative permease subunit n=1 Tax=Nocardiopsis deserti TaxID=2605988 RepID=UPI001239F817|nr:TIGR03943 family protein [Nocardiopsis deserti]
MNRLAQGLMLILLGASLIGTLPTGLYLNYVQGWFQPFLVVAGAILVALGLMLVVFEARAAVRGPSLTERDHDDGHGHDHFRAPRTAWLLLAPVLSVFVIAPPALGAYTAQSTVAEGPPRDVGGGRPLDDLNSSDPDSPVAMEMQDFVVWAWTDEERTMADRTIELTGFAVPGEETEGWYLARLQMTCCAADTVVNRVLVVEHPAEFPEPEKNSWWVVRGTWVEPEGDLMDVRDHRFRVEEVEAIDDPPDPYEKRRPVSDPR